MKTDVLNVKRTGDFYYPIHFEDGFDKLADAIMEQGLENRHFCIVTDTNVGPLYAEKVKSVLSGISSRLSVFTFEAGEKNKNLNTDFIGKMLKYVQTNKKTKNTERKIKNDE